jgi:hypothetical protein
MKTILALAGLMVGLWVAADSAAARPIYLYESERFENPDPTWNLGDAAMEGNDLVFSLTRWTEVEDFPYIQREIKAVLYRRAANGAWTFVRELAHSGPYTTDEYVSTITMKEGILVINFNGLWIYERNASGEWVQSPIGTTGHEYANYVEIDNGRIFHGGSQGTWAGQVLEKNAQGVWNVTANLTGDYRGGDSEISGGPVDIAYQVAGVTSRYNEEEYENPGHSSLSTWIHNGTGWNFIQRLVAPEGEYYNDFALHFDYDRGYKLFAATNGLGTPIYSLSGSHWYTDRWSVLRTAHNYMSGNGGVSAEGPYILRTDNDPDSDIYLYQVNIFRADSNGNYQHVAVLRNSDGTSVGASRIIGQRVLASGSGAILFYDLPTDFTAAPVLQDNFETGNGAGWTQTSTSQFAVAQSGNTRVFRQSSVAGDAAAVLGASQRTAQAIQVQVKPTAFNGNDRWFGLATRYTDSANYYYVTVRSSGVVALKRMKAGQFATLASASFPVTLNSNYFLRLQSVGHTHKVYINGTLVLDVDNDELPAGKVALLTYRTAADFDNVIVTPEPLATVYKTNIYEWTSSGPPRPWEYSGAGLWSGNPNGVLTQTSIAGDARAAVGAATVDQVVEARLRATTFANGNGDPWVGIMARYAEPTSYLYLSLRRGNTLSLRRLYGSQITQLGTVPMTVTPGTWYDLRLECVGQKIRAFVNGQLVIEANDTYATNSGSGGLVTYRAAAEFQSYRAVQP